MTQDYKHPITPLPELVDKWLTEPEYGSPGLTTLHTFSKPRLTQMLTRAAQWGSDQELDACCEWIANVPDFYTGSEIDLRAARRPKPPSLKEQALGLLNEGPVSDLLDHEVDTIRRALEALPDD